MTLPHLGGAAPSRRLWSVDYVLTLLTGHFLFVSYSSMFTVIPNYVNDLGGENWHIGVVVGAFGVLSLFVRPYVGRLIAIFGPKPVAVWGIGSFALAALLYVLPVNSWLEATPLLASFPALAFLWPAPIRMLRGIGLAATPVATSTIVVNLAPAVRRAEGLAYMGIGIGTASLYSPFLAELVSDRFGFSAAFVYAERHRAAGVLAFAMAECRRRGRTRPPRSLPGQREKTPLIPRAALLPTLIFVSFTATTGPSQQLHAHRRCRPRTRQPRPLLHRQLALMTDAHAARLRQGGRPPGKVVGLSCPAWYPSAVGMFVLMYASEPAHVPGIGGAGRLGDSECYSRGCSRWWSTG